MGVRFFGIAAHNRNMPCDGDAGVHSRTPDDVPAQPVSVDAEDFLQRLSAIEDDDISIREVYNAMLGATQILTRPCMVPDIAQQWLTVKSAINDPMIHELVDACIACLLLTVLTRRQMRGGGDVTESMLESARACVQEHWTRAVDIPLDPSSVIEIENL